MKKQSSMFLGIILVLIAGCASSQPISNETSNETSREELSAVKEEIASIEKRLSGVEEKLGKAKELEKEIKQIHSEIDRNLTFGINITVLIVASLALIVTIIGVSLLGYLRTRLRQYRTDINGSLAIAHNINAVDLFKKNKIEEAIRQGSSALKYAIGAYGKYPTEIERKNFLSLLKSNLAYYWVAGNKIVNREIALQYADEGLKTGKDALVDNFLYVFMKLAKTKDEKKHWKEIYLTNKNDVETYYKRFFPKCTDLQNYESFNRKIEGE